MDGFGPPAANIDKAAGLCIFMDGFGPRRNFNDNILLDLSSSIDGFGPIEQNLMKLMDLGF